MQLYEYQKKALQVISERLISLVVMASGLGKTVLATFWSQLKFQKEAKSRVLFLAHENYILEQSMLLFRQLMPQQEMGIFHGQEKSFEDVDILFASFQTMREWKGVFVEGDFTHLIVDEAHHSKAESYNEVIVYFMEEVGITEVLALTATPDRMDGLNIREIFGDEVVNISIAEAIAKGWLSKLEYQIITDNLNQSALQKMVKDVLGKGKRLSIKQLNETIFVQRRDEDLVEILLEKVGSRKTIVFCESILHVENFQQYLPNSATFHSKNSYKVNDANLKSFTENGLQFLLAVDKFNEGIDMPDIEVVVFLRSTDSQRIFLQQLGRGLRRKEGKDKLLVLDFVANLDRIMYLKDFMKNIQRHLKTKEYVQDVLYLKGDAFSFSFLQEEVQTILEILAQLQRKLYISDIPHLAAEYMSLPYNDLPAEEVRAVTSKKVQWKCSKCGWEWVTSCYHRSRNGSGCPACSGRAVTPWNNMAVKHPDLAKEYMSPPNNDLPAEKIKAGTKKKLWWKCSKPDCGYEWQASGTNRLKGTGCPACAGKAVTKENNLLAVRPDLVKEYMYPERNKIAPDKIHARSSKKLWWKCSKSDCGYEWQTRAESRVCNETGCPACANNVATDNNSLLAVRPDLVKEYLSPPVNELPASQVIVGTTKKLWWQCSKCGHKWQARGCSRTGKRGTGCPACVNRVVTKKNNMLVTHPDLAAEYMSPPHNELPVDKIVAGTMTVLRWKCSKPDCDHEWEASGNARVYGKGACPACAGKVVTSKNNLAFTHPILAKEYMPPPHNDLPAEEIRAITSKKVQWKCSKCGWEWVTSCYHRSKNGSGCPACAGRVKTISVPKKEE